MIELKTVETEMHSPGPFFHTVKASVGTGRGPADVATEVPLCFLLLLNQHVTNMTSRTSAGRLVFCLADVTPGPRESHFRVVVTDHTT